MAWQQREEGRVCLGLNPRMLANLELSLCRNAVGSGSQSPFLLPSQLPYITYLTLPYLTVVIIVNITSCRPTSASHQDMRLKSNTYLYQTTRRHTLRIAERLCCS